MEHAVVVGASVAGLLTAQVLADSGRRVTLVERDRLPAEVRPRPGVPQGRHVHVVLSGGQRALEDLLPEVLGQLRSQGVPTVGLPADVVMMQAGRWIRRDASTETILTGTRARVEHVIRHRVLADPRIGTVPGTEVVGLAGDARRVSGVRVRPRGTGGAEPGAERLIEADLVVDASGRGSRAPGWLTGIGARPPREERIDTGLAYATRLYRDGPPADCLGYYLLPSPALPRGAVIIPVEDDGRYLVTLSGLRGDEPPTDPAGFARFAEGLPDPIVSRWLAGAEPAGPVFGYRDTANVRRRYDRSGPPEGFLAVGDALCAFNPVYGQGIAVAAQAAVAMRAALASRRRPPTRRLQRVLLAAAAGAWRVSAGADKQMPTVTGSAARSHPADRVANWYLDRVQAHGATNPLVGSAFRAVLSLTAPVGALFAPRVARTVLFTPLPPGTPRPPSHPVPAPVDRTP